TCRRRIAESVKRLFAWWNAAVAAVGWLTGPIDDVARSDDAVERLLRGSVVTGAADRLTLQIARAWDRSLTAQLVGGLVARFELDNMTSLVRVGAAIVGVAAATALLLESIAPGPADPFFWVLPALGIVAALATAAAARAFDKRH